jgi:DNA-binding Xre family transcriptional regulator
MKRIIVDFKQLNDRIIKIGIPRTELARRLKMEPDTLIKFLKSGKKVREHINLIDKICNELGFSWKEVIK